MPAASPAEGDMSLALTKVNPELVLIVFIHGFKGGDDTFDEFPQRLAHNLSQTIPNASVESVVFPAYETKGELDKAVVRFADWLTTLTVEREVASGLGAGKAKIVLIGHSMGGLLAADSLREFVGSRPDKEAPLWPKITACITYDTPFYGLHPFVVKNSVTKVAEHLNAATALGSVLFGSIAGLSAQKAATPPAEPPAQRSAWSKWAPAAYAVGGALVAGAAAGGAYYKKEELTQGWSWATDHMKYVGSLWDEAALQERVEALIDIEAEHGVVFRNLYTILPPKVPEFLTSRTFVVLPKYGSRAKKHFLPATNSVAPDEIQGHTGMFSATTNDGYYQLGLESTNLIRDSIMTGLGIIENVPSAPTTPPEDVKGTTPSPAAKEPEKGDTDDLIQF